MPRPFELYAGSGRGTPPRNRTSGNPAAFAAASQQAVSMPDSASIAMPCTPTRVMRLRSFCSIAKGATGSPLMNSPSPSMTAASGLIA